MSFIRKKNINGKLYAYEVTTFYDKTKKYSRQKSKYLGVVDNETGDIKKVYNKKNTLENNSTSSILNFGQSYIIYQTLKSMKLYEFITKFFKGKADTIMALISYQIIKSGPSSGAEDWYNISMEKFFYKNACMKSQNLSKIYAWLNTLLSNNFFFKEYINYFFPNQKGLLIDSTALPASVNDDINQWGYTSEGIKKNITCLLLADTKSYLPIYFRTIPGSIPDKSVLEATLFDLDELGLKIENTIFDSGFYTKSNIKLLLSHKINFLTRVPKNLILYKDIIKDDLSDLESFKNAVKYRERALYIKEKNISLEENEKSTCYAYIILDIEKRAKDLKKSLLNCIENKEELEEYERKNKGIFVLLSSKKISKNLVLEKYYTRQRIEQLFGFAKSKNKIVPLRKHTEETINGFLIISFLSVACYNTIKKNLSNQYSVEEALRSLEGLRCKIYNSEKDYKVYELTKKQKLIFEQLKIDVPN